MDSQSYAEKLQQGQTTLKSSLIRFKSGNGIFGFLWICSLILLITSWKLEMHWISWVLVIQLIHCTGITAKWKDQSSMKGKLALQWAAKELAEGSCMQAKTLFLKCRLTLRSKQCCAQFCSISCNHICMDFPNIRFFVFSRCEWGTPGSDTQQHSSNVSSYICDIITKHCWILPHSWLVLRGKSNLTITILFWDFFPIHIIIYLHKNIHINISCIRCSLRNLRSKCPRS